MTISEATKQAMAINGYITTPTLMGGMKIRPTSHGPYIAFHWDGTKGRYGWQPSAEDILAEDWIVIESCPEDTKLSPQWPLG